MTRKQVLNELSKYNLDIDKICNIYYLLLTILYKNNCRLKDVTKIHLIKNTIYFDLENIKNYELCDL